jgi:hypothetical protein
VGVVILLSPNSNPASGGKVTREMDIPDFQERCQNEMTRDVVFLLQRRRWLIIGYPEGYESDGEGIANQDDPEEPYLTGKQLSEMIHGDWDMPCAIEQWDTESVWLSREEATTFAESHVYNYSDGWRVYGIPSCGFLPEIIRVAETRAEAPTP